MKIQEELSRTALLLGEDAALSLAGKRVAIFGIGGVGGHACEALARVGIGALDLFDNDTVSLSNINRQIVALHSTVGSYKVDVMKERILDINPDCKVQVFRTFYLPENADAYPLESYDYIVDAIDTVSAKLELAVRATRAGIPIISAMGAGNKLDATRFSVTDLQKTSGCPLARVMRRELKARGITHLKVVYSTEAPAPIFEGILSDADTTAGKRTPPGSLSYVPAVAGLLLAGEVIKDLTKKHNASKEDAKSING